MLIKYTELKDDKSGNCLLSMPFYACISESCMSGYLMRLGIFPKGVDGGTNNHMSAYVYLMKGKHDSIVNWPFRGVVEITLHNAEVQKVSSAGEYPGFPIEGFLAVTCKHAQKI